MYEFCICVCVSVCACIYRCIYIERERGTCIYIYHISVAIWAQVNAFGLAMSDTPVNVYELKSDEAKIYVVCCDNEKDDVFQGSALLLQEALMDSDCNYRDIIKASEELRKPWKMHQITEMLLHRNWDDYAYFRVVRILHGRYNGLWAIGLGTNNKKLQRAANIALAAAIVNKKEENLETWLNIHGLILATDPAQEQGSTAAPAAPQRVSTAAPAHTQPRHRNRGRQQVKEQSESGSRSRHKSRSRHRSRHDASRHRSRAQLRSRHRSRSRRRVKERSKSRSRASAALAADKDADEDPQQKHFISDMIRREFPRPPNPWLLLYSYDSGLHYYWNPESGSTSYKLPQFQ